MKKFDEECYSVLRKVPCGKVTTYGEIARAIGKPRAARAVGNAMNKNPYYSRPRSAKKNSDYCLPRNRSPRVPCHRVVKADGKIGGFASGTEKKIEMLKKEGVEIVNGKVDLDEFGFHFC